MYSWYFNPRSPCGERPNPVGVSPSWVHFNPSSPCGERRPPSKTSAGRKPRFQSTLPVWGATVVSVDCGPLSVISIHAPRVGSDLMPFLAQQLNMDDFNPRSPCGERLALPRPYCNAGRFQSTLPVWGATAVIGFGWSSSSDFNPRSPCGERHTDFLQLLGLRHFNPRSPCGERPERQDRGPGDD